MAAIGVVNGTDNEIFSPDDNLTREQAATMLARLANAIGQLFSLAASVFTDSESISVWAIEVVGQVQEAGIMNGTNEHEFSQKSLYTREQSIVTMLRMYRLLV